MSKLIFAINMTVDGYCGHLDMIPDDHLHRYFTKLLRRTNLILYGRLTYDLMVPYWPEIAKNQSEDEDTNEFARVFDSLDKILFSRTVTNVPDPKTNVSKGNLLEEVTLLKQNFEKDIFVGSISLASQLSQNNLIDEYYIVIHPVIAGKGPRLFETVPLQKNLKLKFVNSELFSSGAVAHHYLKI